MVRIASFPWPISADQSCLISAVASRQPQRTLYSAEELGLLYTQNNRNNTFKDKANGDPHQSNLYKDDILAKFDELSIREKSTELRNFIHLMNLDTDDTKKVHSLLTKYEQSYYGNTPHNISFVQFGADIMRLCHLLKQPDVALNVSETRAYIYLNFV